MQTIAIFGVPRSGTSWLGQIFNSSLHVAYRFQPLFSYAFKGRIQPQSSSEEINQFFDDLFITTDDFILQTQNISGKKGLTFEKGFTTHLVWKEVRYHHLIEHFINHSNIKVIGLIRHPCGVINSWLNAPKEFDKSWDPMEEWKYATKKNLHKPEEYNGYEKWKEIALMYLKLEEQFPDQFMIQLYEHLNERTEKETEKLFSFAKLKLGRQTKTFIHNSKSRQSDDPYGVYRKEQDNYKWQKELISEIKVSILNDPDFQFLNNRFKWH